MITTQTAAADGKDHVSLGTDITVAVFDDYAPNDTSILWAAFRGRNLGHSLVAIRLRDLESPGTLRCRLSPYFAPGVIDFLIRHLTFLSMMASGTATADALFEVWLRTIIPDKYGMFLHVDVDESHYQRTGRMRCPKLATILHLTPVRVAGGATLICTERPVNEALVAKLDTDITLDEAHALSTEWHLCHQKPNRLIAFAGDLPHMVAPVETPGATRLTLLANYFDNGSESFPDPNKVCNVSPKAFHLLTNLTEPMFKELVKAVKAFTDGLTPSVEVDQDHYRFTTQDLALVTRELADCPNWPA
jgi:hypothetical protein